MELSSRPTRGWGGGDSRSERTKEGGLEPRLTELQHVPSRSRRGPGGKRKPGGAYSGSPGKMNFNRRERQTTA